MIRAILLTLALTTPVGAETPEEAIAAVQERLCVGESELAMQFMEARQLGMDMERLLTVVLNPDSSLQTRERHERMIRAAFDEARWPDNPAMAAVEIQRFGAAAYDACHEGR